MGQPPSFCHPACTWRPLCTRRTPIMKRVLAALALAAPLTILACTVDAAGSDEETETAAEIASGELGESAAALTSGAAKVVYGSSAEGRELLAYKVAPAKTNGKIAIFTFGLHGYEDAFEHDGRALYSIAHKLIAHYGATPADLRQWTVWIIPSANPDGMREGENNFREGTAGAYGRCTSEGQDLNRQFSSSSFAEHDALKHLVDKVKPSVVVDFHGWYNCFYGERRVGRHFADAFNAPYAGSPRATASPLRMARWIAARSSAACSTRIRGYPTISSRSGRRRSGAFLRRSSSIPHLT